MSRTINEEIQRTCCTACGATMAIFRDGLAASDGWFPTGCHGYECDCGGLLYFGGLVVPEMKVPPPQITFCAVWTGPDEDET